MLPLRLLIEDFQIHKKTEIDFTKFNSALILGSKVSDENEASGIGKTTIFTAIEYVLYNEYQRRLVDKIVRKGADKARVTLDADFNGTIYRIQRTRYLKNKTTELLLFKKENDKFIPLDGVRTGDTEKELKKLIKVNYTTFKNVHLFSQGDLSGLASAKDSKTRFSLLEEAAELIDYTNLETLTKKEYISDINKKLDINKALIERMGQPQENIEKYNNLIKTDQETIVQKENERTIINTNLFDFKNQLSTLEKSIIRTDNSELLNKLKEIELELKDKTRKFNDLSSKLKSKNNELSSLGTQTKLFKDDLAIGKQEWDKIIILDVGNKTEYESKIKDFESQKLTLNQELAIIQNQLKNFNHTLPADQSCPECFQKIPEDYRNTYDSKIKQQKAECNSRILSLKEDLVKLSDKITKTKNSIIKIDNHNSNLAQLKNKLVTLDNNIKQNISLGKEAKQLAEHFLQEIKILEHNIKNLNEQQEQINKQISQDIKQDQSQIIFDLKLKIQKEENNLIHIDNQIITSKNNLILNQERLKLAQEDERKLIELKKDKDLLQFDLSVYQELAAAYGNHIPKSLVYGMLDSLQDKVSKWIEKIRPGFEIKFKIEKKDKKDEDVFLITYIADSVEFEYEELSVGERYIISLAFKLALSEVVKDMFGSSILLYALDEVDGPFDAKASESYINVVKELEKEAKVLVISHDEDIKKRFNHFIKIENKGKQEGSCASVIC